MFKRMVLCVLMVVAVVALCGEGYASQRNRFVFTQLRYDGKWDPYPETWKDILEFIVTTTSVEPEPERRVVTLDDDALFSSPFLVVLGTDRFPALTGAQQERLHRYCSNGGLVFVEDSSCTSAGAFDASFRREVAKIFPEAPLRRLPATHPIFRSYYLLRRTAGRRITKDYLEGIDLAGRTAVIYSQNDLLGAWAKDRFGNYLWECVPGGQEQRFETQKLMQNLVMYSVTGTYKSDAIHQRYLDRKLGR